MSTYETINIFLKERSYICALIASAIAYIILLSNTGSMGNSSNKGKNVNINPYYVANIISSVLLTLALVFLIIHHIMINFNVSVEVADS